MLSAQIELDYMYRNNICYVHVPTYMHRIFLTITHTLFGGVKSTCSYRTCIHKSYRSKVTVDS